MSDQGLSGTDREKEKWMASAEVREYARGNKPEDPDDVLPHVGLVDDPEIRKVLNHLAENYNPHLSDDLPARVENTRLYRKLLQRAATDTVTKAIHQGDTQTQSYLVGDPGAQSDISGIKAIERLRDMITRPAPIFYLFGEPGSGKTNLAILLAQLWRRNTEGGVIGSNIRSWKECDRWIRNYDELRAWLDRNLEEMPEGGVTQIEDAEPMLFVFDEASSHASGRGEDGYEAGQKLGPLVYKIRKSRAGLIIIGHDGKDVHPAVRTLSKVIQKREGELKRASVYRDVVERSGVGKIMELNGIPETDDTYDDSEATSWSWESAKDDEQVVLDEARDMAEEMREEQVREIAYHLDTSEWLDLSQTEIGRVLGEAHRGDPYRRSWVSKWSVHYQKERGEFDA